MKRYSVLCLIVLIFSAGEMAVAQPTILNPLLGVRSLATGLENPTGIAFLGQDDMLVLEKNTGRVRRVVNGQIRATVLDLAVNFASERGLLGIALHPRFPSNPGVYLYWTESSSGADTDDLAQTPLLGNRVDRYSWNGTTLTHEREIIRLRARQPAFQVPDGPAEQAAGNHNGGKIAFGPDGRLYILIGDVGRRGQMQNLPDGPLGPGLPDDQFGGPQPDDPHLTGVILRLNDDGTAPADNPFFAAGASIPGEAGANTRKIFAYGIRNGFGLAFDPVSGELWQSEDGDDAFDEINRIEPGMNGGWVRIMGPVERIADYKSIEVPTGGLQQRRWPPARIADTPEQALSSLMVLPGSHYKNPEFSWKFAVSPAGIGFVSSPALGPEFQGSLLVGASTDQLVGGYLFQFRLSPDRKRFALTDPNLEDLVADNKEKNDLTESESLLLGRDFGVVTDIGTTPSGNVFVVSLTEGTIFELFRQ